MPKSIRNDWSDLPSDLLSEIAKRLENRLAILVLRAVCRSWRAAVPYPAFQNGAVLSPIFPYKHPGELRTRFSVSHVYVIQPTINTPGYSQDPAKFWLATVVEENPGRLYLRNPLTREPGYDWPVNFPKRLSLVNFRVVEICRTIRCHTENHTDTRRMKRVLMFENRGPGGGHTFVGLSYDGSLYSCSTCFGQWSWNINPDLTDLEDIVSFKGKICAVDEYGSCYVVDPESMVVSFRARLAHGGWRSRTTKRRLVESNGDVYLVKVNFLDTLPKVYNLDENRRKWAPIDGLGDLSLFIAPDCSFALSSKQCVGFQVNCVYVFGRYPGKDCVHINWMPRKDSVHINWIGMFSLDGSCSRIGKANSCDFLWPPPAWVYAS